MAKINEAIVVVRGGGDIATGVVQKFKRAGFKVVILEVAFPLSIRRSVALSSAVLKEKFQVEDITAELIDSPADCQKVWQSNRIPVLIDPEGKTLADLQPSVVVDAILAKKNLGTTRKMAPITIALGPGFIAERDVDVVIETMRGHSLGRLYFKGAALPNTGIPGELGGKSSERVIHAPVAGTVKLISQIGDVVKKGEPLFYIDQQKVLSPLDGTVRGLIAEGAIVANGLKCGDVDPRPAEEVDWLTISDKARNIGGAALEACLYLGQQRGLIE
ncbi:selenium-dependent molybdenum cofactor biosynthesis protein YqeB [Enterococcus sp. HY326]|uniref:selenium-dependent molybdenum cofactor biosynthesis protein YqeB n=1 Tax=Enterococcus sp. HY326 TaxID=2971265 RepID=UPI00224019B7|nr:selenium-dependent molybdenum cofactor biosynthesis protein YqeB [Enterococcus sp. HY326]